MGTKKRGNMRSGCKRLVVAGVVALVASGCGFVVVHNANPGVATDSVVIVTPKNRVQLTPAEIESVEIRADLKGVDEGSVAVSIDSGDRWGDAIDITDAMTTLSHSEVVGLLDPMLIEPGITRVIVKALVGGMPIMRDVVFSYEPEIDVSMADRCEILGQSRCQLPFPSDYLTVEDSATATGRRVAFHPEAMPQNISGVHIDATEMNRNDGFSVGAAVVTLIPGLDLNVTRAAPITALGSSLDPHQSIVLLDATTGERHPFWAELDSNAGSDEKRTLIIRPARNYPEGHRMIVGLRNLKRSDGTTIEPSRAFRVYRDLIPTFLPEIENRRTAMDRIIGRLGDAGVDRKELFLAWDFTVISERSLSERSLHIRDEGFDSLGGAAPKFNISAVQDNVDANVWRRISGTFLVPKYLTGTGAPGSRFNYSPGSGPDALPARNGDFSAQFVCNIPRSVTRDGDDPISPGRAIAYGHGLLGSKDEVNSLGFQANQFRAVMCATSWIGMSTEDLGNIAGILSDMSGFPTLADRLQQSFLNQMFLARLMKDPAGFSRDPAFRAGSASLPTIATGSVFFNGNSQGGILGGAATALSTEWTRAALGVPAMNFSVLLTRSVHWDSFGALSRAAYPDDVDQVLSQQMVQMLWDRGEANGYAHHLTNDPLPGTPSHKVMLIEAFGDHQVTNVATETMARTAPGMRVWSPALADGRSRDGVPFWGIPALTSTGLPFTGSVLVVWDWGTDAAPITNTPNRAGTDPHGIGFGEPRVLSQVDQFLSTTGSFIDYCSGSPCQG